MLDVYGGQNSVIRPYVIEWKKRFYNKSGEDATRAQFKITTPEREEKWIDIKFNGSFLACAGEAENEFLLLWWSWMKIKERIDSEHLTSELIGVSTKDKEWANEIKQNLDTKVCEALNNDCINYYPEKKLGFI